MNPKQRRTFRNMVDSCLGELVVQHRSPSVEVNRKQNNKGERCNGQENGTASTFDEKKLSSIGAAVAGDFTSSGVPYGKKLATNRGGARHTAVVAPQLHQEENQETEQSADRRYIKKVVDVAIPRAVRITVVAGRRRWRKRISHEENYKVRCHRRG